jgi:hypothetical protein
MATSNPSLCSAKGGRLRLLLIGHRLNSHCRLLLLDRQECCTSPLFHLEDVLPTNDQHGGTPVDVYYSDIPGLGFLGSGDFLDSFSL